MPAELDVPIPKYYVHDNPGRKEREDLLEDILNTRKEEEENMAEAEKEKLAHEQVVAAFRKKLKAYEEAAERMQTHEAIAVIQTYERYRQGRERMAMAKYVAMEEANRRRAKFKANETFKYSPDDAATMIQVIQYIAHVEAWEN